MPSTRKSARSLPPDTSTRSNARRNTSPPTLRDLLAVPGLGPRRIHTLYERLNIRSIGDLSAAVESGRLRTLPGFGDKLESAIRDFLSANTVPGNNTALLEPLLSSLRHDQR